MKLYIINNTRKLKKIKHFLESNYEISIEDKEDSNFKMTKNDFVLISDESKSLDGLEKLKNIIVLTQNKDYRYIWNIANNFKIIDIIDNDLTEDYISNRIVKNINN